MVFSYGLDPLAYLRATPFETAVIHKVIEAGQELLNERKQAEIKAIGAAVANSVGKMFG